MAALPGLTHALLRYGEHALQTVDVWTRDDATGVADDAYFMVYVHGGAWRDPRRLNATAVPGIAHMHAGPMSARFAGFASVGYRLSPHPEFPQDPASTPTTQLRDAKHPDHLHDVWTALETLATHPAAAPYFANRRCIVYGHSCGAFLAYQLWTSSASSASLELPVIVGFEGIYDLRGLVERGGSPSHGGGPGTGFQGALQTIAEGAFGPDPADWDAASPARFAFSSLPRKTLAVLAYSDDDELVDVGEVDTMEAALRQGADAHRFDLLVLRDLHGRHDEVHETGHEIARVLQETVKQLD